MSKAKSKKAITINDVAARAGVSVSTVSRVLNNREDVSEETYKRVTQVIDELAYSSSLAAKGMRSKKTGLIGLIMPDVHDPYSFKVMRGINKGILELDQDLLVYTSGDVSQNETAGREQHYISLLNNGITDGVIIVTPMTSGYSSISPVVSIDPNIFDPRLPAVISSNVDGAYEATKYLISLGHRRIGFVEGRMELQSAIGRKEGYVQALKEAGLPMMDELVIPGGYSFSITKEHAPQLLELSEPPTAVFASNDQSALGVRSAARELGLKIPEDLSIVGFDNIDSARDLELTTVDQSIEEMGYMAAKILVDLIEGKSSYELPYTVQTKLLLRKSTMALKQ